MKILMAVGGVNTASMNPYVGSIEGRLNNMGHNVVSSAEEFWSAQGRYDIVHIHWPQALFGWHTEDIAEDSVARLRDQITAIQATGGVVCYTRHNSVPHADDNPHSVALYDTVERMCNIMIHMGEFSLNETLAKYPEQKTIYCVIPHHAYDWYPCDIDRTKVRKMLSLKEDVPTVLSFGEFRSNEERLLVAESCAKIPGINVLAPLLLVHHKGYEGKSFDSGIRKILGEKFPPQRIGRILDSDVPLYFLASDVVFIQRLEILNSGNLPLAFHFGKVVVGPDCGNVGECLRATGNPTFDPKHPETAIAALRKGLELAVAGKGEENKRFARKNLSFPAVVPMLLDAYMKGLDMRSPSVSIIMPSLNTAKYVREALDSAVNQTLKNIEIICIDAGSEDGTREIILECAKRDSRVRLIDSHVKSYGCQMNLGLKAAKGRYVAILEPDDHICPEMCEELYSQALHENLDIVKGNCVCFETDNDGVVRAWETSSFGKGFSEYGRVFDPADFPDVIREGTLGTTLALYRREMLMENNVKYNESPGASYQDTGFFFQTFFYARRFKAVEKAYYNYRQDNQGSSRNDNGKLMVLWREYEFVLRWLSECLDRDRVSLFEPYVLGRLFSGQLWMIRRIGFEASGELIDAVKAKFLELMSAGVVRSRHLPPQDWNILVSWVKNEVPHSCGCKVSVVIPCFNVSSYVEECLDSVLSQTLKDLECLCVDDGSTDDTIEILKRYAAADPRVRVFELQHSGVYVARNHALKNAKGEFIAFMDPDDLYPSNNILERLYSSAKSKGLLVAGGSLQTFLPNGTVVRTQKPKNVFSEEKNIRFSEYQWALGYQRFIYSRMLLSRLNIVFPPFVRFQDPPFMAAALLAAEEFMAIPDVVYSYRIGYKRPDWKAENYRRFRDLLKALEMMAHQAAHANLQDLMNLVESELDAHIKNVVKPDDDMLSACEAELSAVKATISRFRARARQPLLENSGPSELPQWYRAHNISLLKIFLPYSFLRWWTACRYGYTWPVCDGIKGMLPFFLVASLMQRVPTDRNLIKYLLPYGMMCERMFARHGYVKWNDIPLDGVSPSCPQRARGRRSVLPFGMILFLDKHSR